MAKILIMSEDGYGAWFSLRFLQEGHSVDVYIKSSYYQNVLLGIIPTLLKEKPDFKKYDLVLFDLTGNPKTAEASLKESPTIGDGNVQSQLEDDRMFGIEVMEQVGINVPFYENFDNLNDAKKFIRKTEKRFVFKPSGSDQSTASTYVSKNAEDMLRYLDKISSEAGTEFLLQEVVNGTEISVEGWFNGQDFFLPNSTLEEKKFLNDRHGPNTGCAGNLVWVYDSLNLPQIFTQGLGKMKDWLQQVGFRGMIDLNTIVTEGEIYGLEWTPRFGYDASATLFNLISSDLGDFMGSVAVGSTPSYTLQGTYGAAIRLSVPPYPSEIKGKHPEGIPVQGLCEEDCTRDCYLYDVACDGEELVTAGISGLVAVPITRASTIYDAFGRLYSKVDSIHIPDMQYRTDLECCISQRFKTLSNQGWLG